MQYRVQEPSDVLCSFQASFVCEASHGPNEWSGCSPGYCAIKSAIPAKGNMYILWQTFLHEFIKENVFTSVLWYEYVSRQALYVENKMLQLLGGQNHSDFFTIIPAVLYRQLVQRTEEERVALAMTSSWSARTLYNYKLVPQSIILKSGEIFEKRYQDKHFTCQICVCLQLENLFLIKNFIFLLRLQFQF